MHGSFHDVRLNAQLDKFERLKLASKAQILAEDKARGGSKAECTRKYVSI
jgi:hypothetical protein